VSELLDLDTLAEDWAAMKRLPHQTGLPMAVWVTENDGYRHDVRVKVAVRHGTGTSWYWDSVSVGVRPALHLPAVARSRRGEPLSAADLAQARRWIELNRDVIIDFWDQVITPDEAAARLQRLP